MLTLVDAVRHRFKHGSPNSIDNMLAKYRKEITKDVVILTVNGTGYHLPESSWEGSLQGKFVRWTKGRNHMKKNLSDKPAIFREEKMEAEALAVWLCVHLRGNNVDIV
jgi:hypothetical protein